MTTPLRSQGKCLEHRKSTAAEARSALAGVTFTILGVNVFVWVFFPSIWPNDKLFVIAFVTIEIVVMAVANIRANSVFECRLDEQNFVCISPTKGCGETFSVRVCEIVRFEKKSSGENGYTWHIITVSGQRLWLTSNYDNPVEDFVELILARNPQITLVTK